MDTNKSMTKQVCSSWKVIRAASIPSINTVTLNTQKRTRIYCSITPNFDCNHTAKSIGKVELQYKFCSIYKTQKLR